MPLITFGRAVASFAHWWNIRYPRNNQNGDCAAGKITQVGSILEEKTIAEVGSILIEKNHAGRQYFERERHKRVGSIFKDKKITEVGKILIECPPFVDLPPVL